MLRFILRSDWFSCWYKYCFESTQYWHLCMINGIKGALTVYDGSTYYMYGKIMSIYKSYWNMYYNHNYSLAGKLIDHSVTSFNYNPTYWSCLRLVSLLACQFVTSLLCSSKVFKLGGCKVRSLFRWFVRIVAILVFKFVEIIDMQVYSFKNL